MKKIILTFLFIAFCLFTDFATDKINLDDFNQAKLYYNSNKYYDALKIYSKMYNNGYDNFEINYNIGCVYFKLNEYGRSRFYFERALFYKPFDKDLFYNLNSVYKKTLKDTSTGEQTIMLRRIIYFIPVSAVLILVILFTILALLFFIFTLTIKQRKKLYLIISTVFAIFMFCFFILYYVQYSDYNNKVFVVSSKDAHVYLAPNIEESILTTVTEGVRGKILEESGDYVRVSLTESMNGWLKKNDVIY
jgi:tetratricopeptide (TPR) repeat protein